jgi:ATP-dependent Lon protease
MVTAIVSIMTGIAVKKDVAMTGEITLRGRVLPIGGLKEKLLAALRAGITTVVIPEENVKDLAEIGDEVKAHLNIVAASRMDDVLKVALQRMPTPITLEEEAAVAAAANVNEQSRATAH